MPKLTKHQQREVLARLDRGETLTEIARSYAVSHMTISRIKAQCAACSHFAPLVAPAIVSAYDDRGLHFSGVEFSSQRGEYAAGVGSGGDIASPRSIQNQFAGHPVSSGQSCA
jgi:hypothetical protein